MREANNLDLTLLIFLGVIWGSSFFNIKIATYSYEPFTLALIRVFFASIPLVLLCHYKNIKIIISLNKKFKKKTKYNRMVLLNQITISEVLYIE